MSSGVLILLGLCLVGVAIYNFMNRDRVWEGQVRANEMQGVVSERTESWDMMQSFRGVIAVILGIMFLGVGLTLAASPQPPAGTYSCLEGDIMSGTRNTLTLQGDGRATYDTQTFTWVYDKTRRTLIFTGDTELVSGNFFSQNDSMRSLSVVLKGEGGMVCSRS